MNILTPKAALTAALVLSGCTSSSTRHSEAYNPLAIQTVRVVFGECVFRDTELQSPILAALLPFLIEKGFNAVATALKAAGERDVDTIGGWGNFVVESSPPKYVQVVRGRFLTDMSAFFTGRGLPPRPPWTNEMKLGESEWQNMIRDSGIYPADRPDFFFEGRFRIVESAGSIAMAIAPRYAFLGRPIDPVFSDGRNATRDVLISFAFNDGTEKKPTDPGTDIQLGALPIGRPLHYLPIRPANNEQNGPAPYRAADFGRASPFESRLFSFAVNSKQGKTGFVQVTETRDGNETAAFLAEAFNAVDDTVKTRILEYLDPEKRLAAETAALRKVLDGKKTATAEYAAAVDKLRACAEVKDTSTPAGKADLARKIKEAADAMESANVAAIANSITRPFPNVQLIRWDGVNAPKVCEGEINAALDF